MATRLGIFGGSFDPVHVGHLMVAAAAFEELELDRLMIVPAARSPFKPVQEPAPPEDRLRLLRLAFSGWRRVEVDPLELARGGTSFTIDTVSVYREKFPGSELFYLIGEDHVPSLPRWRSADDLARTLTFVVIPRPGESPREAAEGYRCRRLRGFPTAVSSSQVRRRVEQGKSITTLVPEAVAEAIREREMYRMTGITTD